MPQIKLTKTELRSQQYRLNQLEKYLPTLQLKKVLLQVEVNRAQMEKRKLEKHFDVCVEKVELFAALLTAPQSIVLQEAIKVKEVKVGYENIAGVDLPIFARVEFEPVTFCLFATPVWMEAAIGQIQELILFREKIWVAAQRVTALEKELREVSIRVNLFEKIMIPRAKDNIKKIKIFLGDQELAAVCQAKVSKKKILARKH